MAGIDRGSVDMASIYDCYTITVLMSLENAGFCEKGKGIEFGNGGIMSEQVALVLQGD